MPSLDCSRLTEVALSLCTPGSGVDQLPRVEYLFPGAACSLSKFSISRRDCSSHLVTSHGRLDTRGCRALGDIVSGSRMVVGFKLEFIVGTANTGSPWKLHIF